MKLARLAVPATLALAILAAPLVAEAQQPRKVYRLALVQPAATVADMTEAKDSYYKMLFSELRRLGYVEGQNLVVERRSAEGNPARFPELAREVVQLQPDLIFAISSRLVRALKTATTTIPIVGITGDPLSYGANLVTSLARPGGNFTGFSTDAEGSSIEKLVELLKAAVPMASRVAVLASRDVWERESGARPQAGARVGVTVVGALLGESIQEPEYRRVFAAMVRERVEALVVADHRRTTYTDGSLSSWPRRPGCPRFTRSGTSRRSADSSRTVRTCWTSFVWRPATSTGSSRGRIRGSCPINSPPSLS
jgi:putative ABC transport system substrate-binding protein